MKKFSITTKVAFWYAFSLLVIVSMVIALLLMTSDKLVNDTLKTDVESAVDAAVRDVRLDGKELTIDDDIVYYIDGVSVALFDDDGTAISGMLPEDFKETAFSANEVRSANDYFVYDRLIENTQYGKLWVRGVVSKDVEDAAPAITFMIKIFLVTLPLLIILVLIGGWFITRRALLPIRQIINTAEDIRTSGDLTKRIGGAGSEDSGDELAQMSKTFDGMLDKLQSSFETEKQFTDDAGHELRTPLAVIRSASEYGLENADDPVEAKESLETINNQAIRMSDLLDRLLMLARADGGRMVTNFEEVDLSVICHESVAEHAEAAKARNIKAVTNIENGIVMRADPTLIRRMIDNLLTNGIKYGRNGGYIKLSLARDGGMIIGSVEDDGIGIENNDLEKIWDRFYRADKARTAEDENSLGLGLSIVKLITEVHGGEITAESTPGKGSVFKFTFPNGNEKEEPK